MPLIGDVSLMKLGMSEEEFVHLSSEVITNLLLLMAVTVYLFCFILFGAQIYVTVNLVL